MDQVSVTMTRQEWQWIVNVLATKCTWAEANPFLMKLGDQLRRQQSMAESDEAFRAMKGNSGVERHGDRSD